jgi:hypothetical protein
LPAMMLSHFSTAIEVSEHVIPRNEESLFASTSVRERRDSSLTLGMTRLARRDSSGGARLSAHLRGFLAYLVDIADHEERLLRQIVDLAVEDLLEGADGVLP